MKTLKVSIDKDEEDQILKSLIARFGHSPIKKDNQKDEDFIFPNDEIYNRGQEVNFPISEEVEVWANLELYQDGTKETETNSWNITEQSVVKFTLSFMIDGEEIEVVREMSIFKSIEDRISTNYRI